MENIKGGVMELRINYKIEEGTGKLSISSDFISLEGSLDLPKLIEEIAKKTPTGLDDKAVAFLELLRSHINLDGEEITIGGDRP